VENEEATTDYILRCGVNKTQLNRTQCKFSNSSPSFINDFAVSAHVHAHRPSGEAACWISIPRIEGPLSRLQPPKTELSPKVPDIVGVKQEIFIFKWNMNCVFNFKEEVNTKLRK
jgi:hypothetical protein